jgi:Na+-transporting methylmalonyl-CoA/oxaloacetate decarboxylase gamma subunit
MFVLALVAIIILGVIGVGLLWLLSKFISNQRNQSRQEPETTPCEVNPEQEGNEQLATLIKKIDAYHKQDTRRAKGDRIETLIYVFWGFTATSTSFALATLSLPPTREIYAARIVSIIGAIFFGVFAIWATIRLRKYKKWDWKDPWSEKEC